MKHKVILEFDQPTYAALIAAWATVVTPGYEENLSFNEFVRVAAQCRIVTVLKFVKEERNKK